MVKIMNPAFLRFLPVVALVALSCFKPPVSPYDSSKTKFSLILKTAHISPPSDDSISDTLGDSISIGAVTYLSNNIDSARIFLVSSPPHFDSAFTLNTFKSQATIDTLWQTFMASDTGNVSIIANAFINNHTIISDTVSVLIYPMKNHHKPRLSVSGKTAIEGGELCSLYVLGNDSDDTQALAYSVVDMPDSSSFTRQIFKWTPPLEFTGTDTVVFVVADNGFPSLSDTQAVAILVSSPSDTVNHPPKWEKDTINQAAGPAATIILSLRDKCTDSPGDSLGFSLLSGAPAGDTLIEGIYFYTPLPRDSGAFYPRVIARDPLGLQDTLTIHLMIKTADTLPPILKLLSPLPDSLSVSSNNFPLRLLCKDESDVASVLCALGSDTFHVFRSDSVCIVIVNGLKPGILSAVRFIAVDGSPRANRDTLFVHLKYDSTIADNVPPSLRILSPSKDTVIGADSCTVRMICTDASGISSITCVTAQNSLAAAQAPKSDSLYTATLKGLRGGQWTTLVITAFDKSAAFNGCSLSIRIKYDNDATPPSVRLISPAKDSSLIAGNLTTVQVMCDDVSGVSALSCSMGSLQFTPQKSTVNNTTWSVNIIGLVAGKYNPVTFIATDSSLNSNKDTSTFYIKFDSDTLPPAMTLNTPSKDSISINASSFLIKVACKDASGIASMTCSMNGKNFMAIHNPGDSLWQANVTGLTAGQFGGITCIATDSSIRANKDTLAFFIKYDPTMLDSLGPAFIRVSGPASGSVVPDSIVTIIDSIVDPSNVDSVYWTLNGIRSGIVAASADGTYLIRATLHKFHFDTIVVHAQDISPLRNRSASIIILDYNLRPDINDTSVSTNRNSPVSLTLHAASPDGDPLAWSALSAPSSSCGSISGTLPAVTFTPATNWAGADSFTVKVTDGAWSDTAKIKITVNDVPVPPQNVVIASQPASDTVILGQGIVFSASLNSDVNPAPVFQWTHDGAAIPGARTAMYSISGVTLGDTGTYSVTVTNSAGFATSPGVFLAVMVPPTLSAQPPQNLTQCTGDRVDLTVTATGTQPLTYQWKKNESNIAGATAATFTIASVSPSDVGAYKCYVKNVCVTGDGVPTGGTTLMVNTPASLSAHPTSRTIWAGDSAVFTVIASGTAPLNYQWKRGTANIPGATAASYKIQAVNYSIDNGSTFSCIVSNSCAATPATSRIATLTVNAVKAISGGSNFTLILKTDNTLWSCGNNKLGQLGLGDTIGRLTPTQVMTGANGLDVDAGRYHSVLLKNDNTVWVWGCDSFGCLGLGDSTKRKAPVQVSGMTGVSAVSAGANYSLFLRANGALYACGLNNFGQLGVGDTFSRPTPTLSTTSGLTGIAAGLFHMLALKGTVLFGAGKNDTGQLGSAASNYITSPVQIETGVTSIDAGLDHSLILKDNILYSTGYNGYGQLGDGTSVSRKNPVQVMTGVARIAAGGFHTLILKTDGTLWSCGYNEFGQLGKGTKGASPQPNPVQIMANVSAIAGGGRHSLIIKTDGSLWACGRNDDGQLGDGTTTERLTPVHIKW